MPDADGATTEIEGGAGVGGGAEALHARIAGRFARAEPRRRVLAYLRGPLGNVGRKTVGSWPSMPARPLGMVLVRRA